MTSRVVRSGGYSAGQLHSRSESRGFAVFRETGTATSGANLRGTSPTRSQAPPGGPPVRTRVRDATALRRRGNAGSDFIPILPVFRAWVATRVAARCPRAVRADDGAARRRSRLLRKARSRPVPGHSPLLPDHGAGPGGLGSPRKASARGSASSRSSSRPARSTGCRSLPRDTRKGKPCQRTPLPERDSAPRTSISRRPGRGVSAPSLARRSRCVGRWNSTDVRPPVGVPRAARGCAGGRLRRPGGVAGQGGAATG